MGTYRFFLAILVAISHMGQSVLGVNPGVVAVISFLMLSGYVMTALIRRYYLDVRLIPAFYLDRALRLQPQYLFYLALTVVYFFAVGVSDVMLNTVTIGSVVLNALIVPANFYMTDLISGRLIIPPAWSLGLEACFYFVIPFLLIFRWRLVAFSCSLIVFLFAYSKTINTDWFGYRLLPGTLFMLLIGSFLCDSGRYGKAIIMGTYALCCALLAATLIFNINRVPYNSEVLLGVVIGLPIIAFLVNRAPGKLDQELGNISYGVFLNHFLLVWIWREWGMSTPTLPQMAALILVSVGLGWASYHLIERPAISIRKRLRELRSAGSPGTLPTA